MPAALARPRVTLPTRIRGRVARVPRRAPHAEPREWAPPDEGGVSPPGESTWTRETPREVSTAPPEWESPEPAPAPRTIPTEPGPEAPPLRPRPDDDPPWFPPPSEGEPETETGVPERPG